MLYLVYLWIAIVFYFITSRLAKAFIRKLVQSPFLLARKLFASGWEDTRGPLFNWLYMGRSLLGGGIIIVGDHHYNHTSLSSILNDIETVINGSLDAVNYYAVPVLVFTLWKFAGAFRHAPGVGLFSTENLNLNPMATLGLFYALNASARALIYVLIHVNDKAPYTGQRFGTILNFIHILQAYSLLSPFEIWLGVFIAASLYFIVKDACRLSELYPVLPPAFGILIAWFGSYQNFQAHGIIQNIKNKTIFTWTSLGGAYLYTLIAVADIITILFWE